MIVTLKKLEEMWTLESLKSPFYEAAMKGEIEIFKMLFDDSEVKHLKEDNDGTFPLSLAAGNGYLTACDLVKKYYYTSVTLGQHKRTTPLHLAAQKGNLEMFQLIFKNVQDKTPKDCDQNTPLYIAAETGNLEIR